MEAELAHDEKRMSDLEDELCKTRKALQSELLQVSSPARANLGMCIGMRIMMCIGMCIGMNTVMCIDLCN